MSKRDHRRGRLGALSTTSNSDAARLRLSCTGDQIAVSHEMSSAPAKSCRITFDISDGRELNPSCLLPLFLLPAMSAHADIEIEGPVSPVLLRRANTIQDLYESWLPAVRRVGIQAQSAPPPGQAGMSLLFTAGLDSMASLIRLKDQVTELVTVHGFDVRIGQPFENHINQLQEACAYFHKPLVVVRTDLREVTDGWFKSRGLPPWGFYHGGPLAAVLIAMARQKGVIASSYSYSQLHPWGSHPVLDPLWSTENTEIIHEGAEQTRLQKLRVVGEYPGLLQYLRVCWEGQHHSNCGRCEKCLRTMTALEGLGLLRGCSTFPAREVDPSLLRGIAITGTASYFWKELVDLPLRPEITAIIQRLLQDEELGLPSGRGPRSKIKRVVSALSRAGKLLKAAFT